MKVYKSLEDFKALDKAVVTIGTFDGVHIGHQKILATLRESAEKIGGETVLLTFFPHPRMILHPEDENIRLINDIQEKSALLSEYGLDHLIITPFTRDFSNQNAEEYIRDVLINKLGTKVIVIGYDHRFGKDRCGSFEDLVHFSQIYGFEVQQIPKQDIDDIGVSSTKIREALIKGDIETTNLCLGHPFVMTGKVIRGAQLGRTIGFPTANIQLLESHKLIPAYGIYAVHAQIIDSSEIRSGEYQKPSESKKFEALGYIGNRPTVDGINRSIEINLLDFSGDLYGKTLKVEFLHFIRYDEKFDSLDEMMEQMEKDKKNAQEFFKNLNSGE